MTGVTVGVDVRVKVGAGDAVRVAPPRAVGVAYCPHREAFPAHAEAASKKDAAIRKLISRFTKESAAENYTCRRRGA
jgi:hypothetical protein